MIILDDCASAQDVQNRTSGLVKLASLAWHCSLSTIVITLELISITKPYCENISKLVTFYNPNWNDMKTIRDDYLYGVEKDEINTIIDMHSLRLVSDTHIIIIIINFISIASISITVLGTLQYYKM